MNLPPTSGPRANSGVSRLAMMQARLQAQQLVDREQKIIHFLEERQEEAIRRIAYSTVGRAERSDQSHSANSLSSTNSNNSSVSAAAPRPGQLNSRSALVRSESNNVNSPIGWDKSFPLRPMADPGLPPTEITRTPSIGSGLYKRNSTAGLSNLSGNKYSGGYGPKGNYVTRSRGYSLDRMQGSSLQTSPTRRPSYGNGMPRTRSQAQILGHSSGEDSYASSSRPPSTYDTYSSSQQQRQHEVNLNRSNSHLYGGSSGNRNANTAITETIYIDGPASPPGSRKTSYTREYVRNLPSVPSNAASTPSAARGRLNKRRDVSPTQNRINNTSSSTYDHSSYSSQSSEKSETGGINFGPSFTLLNATPKTGRRASDIAEDNNTQTLCNNKRTTNETYNKYDTTRPKINSQTFRKSRSPGKRTSRSPSRSPGRSGDENDWVNNNENTSGNNTIANAVSSGGNTGTGNTTFIQQQKSIRAEREEEKRRLQAEMRRRESELLAKIKAQQRELESMKQEKGKVERELHRQELMRERERKMVEDKFEQLKPAMQRVAPLTKRQIAVSRSSSSATSSSASKPDPEDEEEEEEEDEIAPRRLNRGADPPLSRRAAHPPLAKTLSQDKSRSRIANPSPAVSRRNNRVAAIGSNSPAVNRRNQSPSAATTTTKTTTQRRTQSDQRRNEPLPGVTQPPGRNNKRPEPGREPLTLSSLRAAAGNSQPPPPSSREQPPVPVAQSTPKPARKPVKKPAGGGNANKNPPARLSRLMPKPRDDLAACTNCGRNFADDRIEKHQEICIKTATKKRKTFDMAKKRLEGTDAENFAKRKTKGYGRKTQTSSKAASEAAPKKSDWRKKRQDFIAALRAAKEAQRHLAAGGKISDLPPPPPSDTSDYVQCPHCSRRFAEGAAERHIPKCKNILSNKRR